MEYQVKTDRLQKKILFLLAQKCGYGIDGNSNKTIDETVQWYEIDCFHWILIYNDDQFKRLGGNSNRNHYEVVSFEQAVEIISGLEVEKEYRVGRTWKNTDVVTVKATSAQEAEQKALTMTLSGQQKVSEVETKILYS